MKVSAKFTTARATGAALVALGLATGARWLLPWEAVAQLIPGSRYVGAANAVLFMTSGLCLLASGSAKTRDSRAHYLGIAVLLVLPALHLMESLLGTSFGIDLASPGPSPAGIQAPGRLSPNASVAFMVIGLALCLRMCEATSAKTAAYLAATFLVGGVGLFGFAGHFLGLEPLYQVANFNRLLPATALGFVLAAAGLWSLHVQRQRFDLRDAAKRIQRRSLAVVTLLCIAAGVAGFASMRDTFEESLSKSVLHTATNNATSIAHSLDVGLWFPRALSTGPTVQQSLERLSANPNDEAAMAALQNIANSFLKAGVSEAEFYNAQGNLVASVGVATEAVARVSHPLLNAGQDARLVWNEDGYSLVADNPVMSGTQVIGRVKTEQPLVLVSQLVEQMRQADATSDAVLCGREGADALCAETRFRKPSFRLPLDSPEGVAARGIARALSGETGVAVAKDARDVDVLSAFAPVKNYGLALGYKTDIDTLYAPLRSRVATLLGAMVLLVGLAIFALRSQVQPVLMRLVESEQKMKSILDDQEEMVSLATPEGVLTYVNPAYARHFGLREEELLGQSLYEHVYPTDIETVRSKISRVLTSGVAERSENRMRNPDGSPRWVAWTNTVRRDLTGAMVVHSVGRDVTERRAAEEALRSSEAALERTGRLAGVGGWELDLRSRAVQWTRETRAIHEVPEDFVPTLENSVAFYANEGREAIGASVELCIATAMPWDLELPLVTAKGRHIWVRAQGQAVLEGTKTVALVGAFQDITTRKALETSLRELTTIFDNTTDYVIQTDWRGNVVYLNPAARDILGLDATGPLEGLKASDFHTPESERLLVDVALPAVQSKGSWIGETTVKAGGGRLMAVTHMVIGHRDSKGRVSRYSGIMRDITEELAGKRQQQRQAAILRTVTEAIPAGVAVVDTSTCYRFVNSGFERWLKKPREQILGHPVSDVLSETDYARSLPFIERALAGETVSFEREFTDGAARLSLAVTYVPMLDDAGNTEGFVGIVQDITQHRQEEVRLLRLSQRDNLTGLLNRAGFEQFMEGLAASTASPASVALLYVDLDRFKPVNDTFGHPVGDKLLQQFAHRLQATVRPTDGVARVGGDEFAVVLSRIREDSNAYLVARKVVQAAQEPFVIDGLEIQIGASVGVAVGYDAAAGWHSMVKRADVQLYQAKTEGRGRVA